MEINYTFYFLAFFEKVIKKLLTFCYWQNCKIDFDFLWCQTFTIWYSGASRKHVVWRNGTGYDRRSENSHVCHHQWYRWHIQLCVKRLTCFSCRMLWIWQWECTAHHRWDKIAPDWCGFCLPLSHVLPKNGYKKTAVKCSVFTTVCFVFNSILGVTTQGKL